MPEEKKLTPEEQLEKLRSKLLGNQSFAALRGRLNDNLSLSSVFFDHVEKANSPTSFNNAWQASSKDLMVMGNLLVKLERDEWSEAARQLKQALTDQSFVISGETIPLHETVPITVIVPDFDELMRMMGFASTGLFVYVPLYKQLLAQLEDGTSQLSQEIQPLLTAYSVLGQSIGKDEIRSALLYVLDSRLSRAHQDTADKLCQLTGKAQRLCLANSQLFSTFNLALVYQAKPREITKHLSRANQKTVTVWSFGSIPRVMVEQKKYVLGLHHESHHQHWENTEGIFTSKATSREYGACMFHPEGFSYQDYLLYHNSKDEHGVTIMSEGEPLAVALVPLV